MDHFDAEHSRYALFWWQVRLRADVLGPWGTWAGTISHRATVSRGQGRWLAFTTRLYKSIDPSPNRSTYTTPTRESKNAGRAISLYAGSMSRTTFTVAGWKRMPSQGTLATPEMDHELREAMCECAHVLLGYSLTALVV